MTRIVSWQFSPMGYCQCFKGFMLGWKIWVTVYGLVMGMSRRAEAREFLVSLLACGVKAIMGL